MAAGHPAPSTYDVVSPVREGDILAGKYRVECVLAEGGMGVVVKATHTKLDVPVALKFMLPDLAGDVDAEQRFMREARAAACLRSEHAARILDVCELETGEPYIVMELLEGGDLSLLISSSTPMSVEQTVDYVAQACEAIAEAHALGIVHRDLKPENLFLTHRRDGSACVKVLDFGISKIADESRRKGARITTGGALGSPAYMSPEQMHSTRDVDGRADIWSLGVILYELVSGRQPFNGRSVAEICLQVMEEDPVPLLRVRPDAPPGFAKVVHACLEKDPAQRIPSATELMRALAPYGSRQVERSAVSSRTPTGNAAALDLISPPTVRTKRSRWAPPTLPVQKGALFAFGGTALVTVALLGLQAFRPPAAASAGDAARPIEPSAEARGQARSEAREAPKVTEAPRAARTGDDGERRAPVPAASSARPPRAQIAALPAQKDGGPPASEPPRARPRAPDAPKPQEDDDLFSRRK